MNFFTAVRIAEHQALYAESTTVVWLGRSVTHFLIVPQTLSPLPSLKFHLLTGLFGTALMDAVDSVIDGWCCNLGKASRT